MANLVSFNLLLFLISGSGLLGYINYNVEWYVIKPLLQSWYLYISCGLKMHIKYSRNMQCKYLQFDFYLRASKFFQTVKAQVWQTIRENLSIAELNSFLCYKKSWEGARTRWPLMVLPNLNYPLIVIFKFNETYSLSYWSLLIETKGLCIVRKDYITWNNGYYLQFY